MACYMDEEQIYKCSKHPSKRRRNGICPTCLRDRLIILCPECANKLPCSCCPDSTSSSSSSSSSFSIFQFSRAGSLRDTGFYSGTGEIGRVSNLIENEPAFRKSRSLAIPFLRSRSNYDCDHDHASVSDIKNSLPRVSRSKINFLSFFYKSNKSELSEDYSKMVRSRSVAVGSTPKRKGWYFTSPIKAFRQAKTSNLGLRERSPMHRG
ncbi:uncharacterized protein [Rutidosis leptorrhynchoides]|uniref:uncharacterized protein n=1 Tax=Rutidosis leptorrhynchoides TaxID=125765 RepID=UPI003A99B258